MPRIYKRITLSLDKEVLKALKIYAQKKQISSLSQAAEKILKKGLEIYKIKQAVIMAGGKGERLRPFTYELPKPLIPIKGKPIIEHIIDLLKKYKIEEIIISIGYLGDKIKEALGDGSRFDLKIIYVKENRPLGTAGSLVLAKKYLKGPFFLLWADNLVEIDLDEMSAFHKEVKPIITIALANVEEIKDFGAVELSGHWVKRFLEKVDSKETSSHLVNAGIALVEPQIFNYLPKRPRKISIEREIYPKLAKLKKLAGFPFSGTFFDIGTMERYEEALKKWKNKHLKRRNENGSSSFCARKD